MYTRNLDKLDTAKKIIKEKHNFESSSRKKRKGKLDLFNKR